MSPSRHIAIALGAALSLAGGGCATGVTPVAPVTIVTPEADVTVSGAFVVMARLSDPEGAMVTVELVVDGAPVHAWSPSREVVHSLDASALGDGAHVIDVIAYMRDGSHSGARRAFLVDSSAPSLRIMEPAAPSVFVEDGPAPFVVQLAPGSAVVGVTLQADDEVIAMVDRPTRAEVAGMVPVDTLLGDERSRTVVLTARAEDETGAVAEVSTTVTIERHERWAVSEDAAFHAPLVLPGAVALGTDDRLVIYDSASGTQRCRVDGVITSASLLYVPERNAIWWSTTDQVRAIDASSCAVLGTRASGGDVVTGLARTPGGVLMVTFGGRAVLANLDVAEQWSADLAAAVTDGGVLEIDGAVGVAPDGTAFVAGRLAAGRGAVFAIDGAGTPRYAPFPADPTGGLLATEAGAFIPGADGRLYRVLPDLTRPWRTPPILSEGAMIECTPARATASLVAVCDGESSVHAVSIEDGTVAWTYDATAGRSVTRIMGRGGLVASPSGGRLALGDRLGMVHILDGTGRSLWRATVGTTPTGLTAPSLDDTTLAVADDAGLLAFFAL